jgi:threonylcarbamoyladenosine tRNA methylthiotransferase MtaB
MIDAMTAPTGPIRRVALLTLGCKLNQAESEAIARDLTAAGCRATDAPAAVDAFVINTCAVTHIAARKSRHLVRLARRLSPQARIAVTGCYAESDAALLRRIGADLVLGNGGKPALVADLLGNGFQQARALDGRPPCDAATVCPLRTRSFVKVQEGCNDVCAFCVVPRARGRERSVPAAEVVDSVRAREADGVREVVLTGTQLGAYGRDNDEERGLTELIESLLAGTSLSRLRLSSLQPPDITQPLLRLWEDPRLCRHFHLALQSGSDAVLARMRRRYDAGRFRQAVAAIREKLPHAAITTDVLVGFPGETEAEFEETYRLCREVEFAALHVFPYSRRSGTLAARMPEQVPETVKRARVRRMLGLARELNDRFLRRFEGEVTSVLWERSRQGKDGTAPVWEGLTDNYIRVFAASVEPLSNRLLPVRLSGRRDGGFWGELVS